MSKVAIMGGSATRWMPEVWQSVSYIKQTVAGKRKREKRLEGRSHLRSSTWKRLMIQSAVQETSVMSRILMKMRRRKHLGVLIQAGEARGMTDAIR